MTTALHIRIASSIAAESQYTLDVYNQQLVFSLLADALEKQPLGVLFSLASDLGIPYEPGALAGSMNNE